MTFDITSKGSQDALADALRKYRGLLSEYMTLKERWTFASKVLENTEILPDVFREGGLDYAISFYSNLIKGPEKKQRPSSLREMHLVSDMRYALENIAKIVSLVKSGFFQRTDSMDLPYVIAGIPLSPERSWGNELYLVAADKLVRNYIQHLEMKSVKWDGFVSWSEYRQHGSLRGGHYIPFRNTFHLVLSMDIKYNLEGLLILAHELGHAACQMSVDTMGRTTKSLESYTISSNALQYTFAYRKRLLKVLQKCDFMQDCPLRHWRKLLTANSQQAFVEAAAHSVFAASLFECLVDMIAVQLAGTSYVSGMVNYAFQSPVRNTYPGSSQLLWNQHFFIGILLRISMLLSFLKMKSKSDKTLREYCNHSERCFDRLLSESNESLNLLNGKRITQEHFDRLRECMSCIFEVSRLLGPYFAENAEEIFGDVYKSSSPAFLTNENAIKDLLSGKTIVNMEPRMILDSACKAMAKTKDATLSAALYSLAFNKSSLLS